MLLYHGLRCAERDTGKVMHDLPAPILSTIAIEVPFK